MNTLPFPHIPDFDGVVEGAGDHLVAVRVEVETDNLGGMTLQCVNLLPAVYVPQLCCVVHGAGGYCGALRIERKAHDLSRMTSVCVVKLTRLCAPKLARLVKRTCDDLVTIWIIKSNCVNHVFVPLERQQLFPRVRVPDLAGAVIAPSDEFVS